MAAPESESETTQLNIGGQIFESSLAVLMKEPDSVLAEAAQAAQTADEPPFYDRDWWAFRYVLSWLRDGDAALPSSKPLLKQLYIEAGAWRLRKLRRAIKVKYAQLAAKEADSAATLANEAAMRHGALAHTAQLSVGLASPGLALPASSAATQPGMPGARPYPAAASMPGWTGAAVPASAPMGSSGYVTLALPPSSAVSTAAGPPAFPASAASALLARARGVGYTPPSASTGPSMPASATATPQRAGGVAI